MTWHIVSLSTGENIFQLDKEVRRLKLAQRVVLRLFMLTKKQIDSLANAPEEVAKLVAFYAVIKTDLERLATKQIFGFSTIRRKMKWRFEGI